MYCLNKLDYPPINSKPRRDGEVGSCSTCRGQRNNLEGFVLEDCEFGGNSGPMYLKITLMKTLMLR